MQNYFERKKRRRDVWGKGKKKKTDAWKKNVFISSYPLLWRFRLNLQPFFGVKNPCNRLPIILFFSACYFAFCIVIFFAEFDGEIVSEEL